MEEILCDHRLKGVSLPPNLIVIAACNPYRKINRPPQSGLFYRSGANVNVMVKKEDMQYLVYLFLFFAIVCILNGPFAD